jgi:multidrug transporter EmrE-like cation transporter
MPPRVWLWAVATGLTQYAAVNLVKWALKKGPLSALWCAISLSFLPVVAWSYAYFGETLTLTKSLAILLAIGCVFVSSRLSKPDSSTPPAAKPKFNFLYGLILVAIIVLNCLTYVGSKDLAMWHLDGGQSYIDAFGGGYLGPRGEYYDQMPTNEQLRVVYGF